MPSQEPTHFTFRYSRELPAEDLRWAVTVVPVAASARVRSALLALVAEAEALSGSVRPSLRGSPDESAPGSTGDVSAEAGPAPGGHGDTE